MSRELKYELALPCPELASLLRALAETLEQGAAPEAYRSMLQPDLTRVRLDIRPGGAGSACRVKLRVESGGAPTSDEDTPEDSGRPKYSSLKKRMKADFKAINAALAQGALPDETAVTAFLADSETMCTYPGKGDSHYPEYREALAEFRAAWLARDLPALRAGAEALADCKRRCHDLYK